MATTRKTITSLTNKAALSVNAQESGAMLVGGGSSKHANKTRAAATGEDLPTGETQNEDGKPQPQQRRVRVKAPKKKVEPMPPMFPHSALRHVLANSPSRKFNETVELILNTTLDTRKQNQQLRVVADLPFGLGKSVSLAVFTSNEEAARKAREAGVAIVGGNELVESIASGATPLTFEKSLASPEMNLNKIARMLGPRGLMPSKKLGTVVDDIEEGVRRALMGTVEVRANKSNVVQLGFGKRTMPLESLVGNLKSIMLAIENNRPVGARGKLVNRAFIKSCMGHPVEMPLESLDPKSSRFLVDIEGATKSKPVSPPPSPDNAKKQDVVASGGSVVV